MRSSVSMVMRLPSRKRCTSLPSFTARRPKVDSAMSASRQNSEIRLRIWSFFMQRWAWDSGGIRVGVLPPSAQRGNRPQQNVGYFPRHHDQDEAGASLAPRELLPPHLVRHIDRELELSPLLFLGKEVAFLGRGEAALRRYRKLLQGYEFGGFFQPPLDVVFVLKLAEFRGDDPDHHDLVAGRQEAQRLEAAGAVGIIFEEIAVVIGAPQHGFRHRLVAAGGNPGGAEIAAADMGRDHHVGGPLRY